MLTCFCTAWPISPPLGAKNQHVKHVQCTRVTTVALQLTQPSTSNMQYTYTHVRIHTLMEEQTRLDDRHNEQQSVSCKHVTPVMVS